jgi:hypothetical protein
VTGTDSDVMKRPMQLCSRRIRSCNADMDGTDSLSTIERILRRKEAGA